MLDMGFERHLMDGVWHSQVVSLIGGPVDGQLESQAGYVGVGSVFQEKVNAVKVP